MIIPTQSTLEIQRFVSSEIENLMTHHLSHALLDIAYTYPMEKQLNYLEVGCFAGGSACLMLQRSNTKVVSVDSGEIISSNLAIKNAEKLRKENTIFNYVKGNSQSTDIFSQVKNIMPEADMLYIDGYADFYSVTKNFQIYCGLVKIGGFIIFNDFRKILSSTSSSLFDNKNFEIIGYLQNSLKARPESLEAALYVIKRIS